MSPDLEKFSEYLTGPPRQSAPAVWKWLLRGAWTLPVLFILLFPLAFTNRGIYIDEAWIGQQVYSLLHKGVIITDLFRDYPPLDKTIVIYHKLIVWMGALTATIFGWGLYQLRLVSALSGIATLLMMYLFIKSIESRRAAAIACLILLWSPVFWEQMRIFRPEMLMTCLGFASFLILWEAYMKESIALTVLAGAFAGWSGLAHPIGLFFMISGAVALLFEREFKLALILALTSLFAFAPYLTGLLIDWRLFFSQLFDNGVMASKLSLEWWRPFLNLFNEHMRIFRGPDTFGITILLIISLFLTSRKEFKENRFFWTYLITLFILEGAAPFPKIIRYMLPVTPFFALAASRAISSLSFSGKGRSHFINIVYIIWIGAYVIYGGYALGAAAFGERTAVRERETNRMMAEKMKKTTLVMAPFDFVFDQVDNFTIQSWWGCEEAAGDTLTPQFVNRYAASRGVEYIILNDINLKKLKIGPDELGRSFRQYAPLYLLPKRNRYLLMKIHRTPELSR